MDKLTENIQNQSIYQENYKLAAELAIIPDTQAKQAKQSKTLKASNLMDLHIMSVDMPETGAHNKSVQALLMTHLFDAEGNIIQAPEMVILVDQANKVIEPYSLTRAKKALSVKEEEESLSTVIARKTHQNHFLKNWLMNLKALDYKAN